MKRSLITWICILSLLQGGASQKIIGAETRYNNSFREWILLTDDEEIEGELRMRWTFSDNWSEWDMRVGDVVASIEQKWKDDPNLWVIRCDGITVNAKTAWTGEFNRWKLSDGKHQINWQSKYANVKDEWEVDSHEDYFFQANTNWEGDPRAWRFADEMPEDVSAAMKMAMVFLTLHFSSPRI
jgi:hypothetical protein